MSALLNELTKSPSAVISIIAVTIIILAWRIWREYRNQAAAIDELDELLDDPELEIAETNGNRRWPIVARRLREGRDDLKTIPALRARYPKCAAVADRLHSQPLPGYIQDLSQIGVLKTSDK